MKGCVEVDFRSAKRDRTEIVSVIIAITHRPTCLTRIMGRANLSYAVLKDYLGFMIGRRLVERLDVGVAGKRCVPFYQATEKGNMFLELYCEQLILLHGEHFLDSNSNLAEAYLIQYGRKNRQGLVQSCRKRTGAFASLEKDVLSLIDASF